MSKIFETNHHFDASKYISNLGRACFNVQEPVWIPGVEKAAAAYRFIFEI